MTTVVVCDDDSILRSTVSDLCEQAGLRVVAETDRGSDAVALVRRFGVDVLVLDLAMGDDSGERTLEALSDVDPHPIIVVFTAYAGNPSRLIRMGAREVIEKPDFPRLSAVLERLASGAPAGPTEEGSAAGEAAAAAERRRTSRPVPALPDLWRSPSGICAARDLPHTLEQVVEGDAVLVLAVRDLEPLQAEAGPLLVADCGLTVARLLRGTLRTQDVVHECREVHGFVAVLRGGDGRAAAAAWQRLVEQARSAGVPGRIVAADARVDVRGAAEAVNRAIVAVRTAGPATTDLVNA